MERDKLDVKSKKEEITKTKPNIKSIKDIKMIKFRPDMNKITDEEEKATLILGITAVSVCSILKFYPVFLGS